MDLLELGEPLMLKGLLKRWSLLPILLKKLFNNIFCLRGYCIPWLETEVRSILNGLSCNFLILFVIEWENSTQKEISDDSQTP